MKQRLNDASSNTAATNSIGRGRAAPYLVGRGRAATEVNKRYTTPTQSSQAKRGRIIGGHGVCVLDDGAIVENLCLKIFFCLV